MAGKSRVLFISAPIGSGHIRAAQAVAMAMKKEKPETEVNFANVFDFFPEIVGNTILKVYFKILDIVPAAYGAMYGWGNQSPLALAVRKLISRYLAARMRKYIKHVNPTLIVCTHATPAGLIAYLKGQGTLDVPAFAIVTDFAVHRLWVYPELDYYYVGHEGLRDFLAEHGISRDKSMAVGIPVAEAFAMRHNGLNDRKPTGLGERTVLVMGGGAGVLPMEDIVKSLASTGPSLHIIAVAGNNNNMRERLMQLNIPNLEVFGFVNNVDRLMAAADILISKPGGMTSAEALSQGLPMLIYKPIPGQEEANTAYLLVSKAAVRADTIAEMQTVVKRLLEKDTRLLEELRQSAVLAARPTAAEDIAKSMFSKVYLSR